MAKNIYNNLGLVNHAKKALKLKTKYMWGGILRPIEQQIDTLRRIYGNQSGTGYSAPRWNELKKLCGKGYFGVDCIGLVKSYYWSGKTNGGTGSPKYGAANCPDVNATYMYRMAKEKGDIKDIPEIPGLIVFSVSHPHVGIYIGNGQTIESTLGARGDGVVLRDLDNFWEKWFKCPYIEYKDSEIIEPKQTTEKIAREVIAGKWGTGQERKNKLAAAGYNPSEVQLLVNEILAKGLF